MLQPVHNISGISEEERKQRNQKNLVSTQLNFIGWLLQASLVAIYINTNEFEQQRHHNLAQKGQIGKNIEQIEHFLCHHGISFS